MTAIETLEDVQKAIQEVCAHHLFAPNNEVSAHVIKTELTLLVHEAYSAGFKIADVEGDPIDNVEDVEVIVEMGYSTEAYLVPTQEYWNAKKEKQRGAFERQILAILANEEMASFDPSI